MCGIAGKVTFKGPIEKSLLEDMASVLDHRGPDEKGVYLNNGSIPRVGLSHARLSIIDLDTGSQPMPNPDGSIRIVFNGEIYNFLELRKELESEGCSFKTRSDTEVIIKLYEKYGEDMLRYLRGVFSFAVFDNRNKKIFCARDRVGKKPFYYYHEDGVFVFGSEIKAITCDKEVKRMISGESIDFFLSNGYTPTDLSIYQKIKKLPQGHFLVFDMNGVRTERYWDIKYANPRKIKRVEEYEEELLEILKEATRIRMISDVPIGAFLSGGVDSSLVVAMMAGLSDSKIKTFTIGFDYEDYSETKYASIVAKHLGTDHSEFIVKPDALKLLEKLVWHYNEPYGDSSCLPSFYVANKTAEHVKVALNGDGGDESFAGYDRYKGARISGYLDALPKLFFKGGETLIKSVLPAVKGKKRDFLIRRMNFMQAMSRFPKLPERYGYWMSYFTREEKESLYTEAFKNSISLDDSSTWISDMVSGFSDIDEAVNRMMKVDINSNLVGDLLVKMDIACMANSLEGRSPLLDHKLMEYAARLPVRMKLKGMESKFLLKKLASRFIPEEVLYRKKMGFGVPIGEWFRHEMKEYIKEILLDDRCVNRGYFKKNAVEKIIQEHQSGARDNKYRIWSLLNLELWHKVFEDNK